MKVALGLLFLMFAGHAFDASLYYWEERAISSSIFNFLAFVFSAALGAYFLFF